MSWRRNGHFALHIGRLAPAPQLPFPLNDIRHRQLSRVIDVHHPQRRERPRSFRIVALQTPHALAHLGQPVVPSLALEKIPERVRIEDADVPALARHLHRVMPTRDIEQGADGVH